MFTGLVDAQGKVLRIRRSGATLRLTLAVPSNYRSAARGSSVSVNGCCLTVVSKKNQVLSFEVVPETLERTNLKNLAPGDRVNLERPLKWGGRVEGHFVQGHVDTVALVVKRMTRGAAVNVLLKVSEGRVSRFLVEKGSVALNGVSLTVGRIPKRGHFWVHLIPSTLKKTNLGRWTAGSKVNLEADLWLKATLR